jgi:hypothetical protein
VPPFFSIITPFIVLGIDEAIVRIGVKLVLGVSWEVRAAVRWVVEDSSEVVRAVRAVNIEVFGWGLKLLEGKVL